MRIEYKIVYIYVPGAPVYVPPTSVGGGNLKLRQRMQRLQRQLDALTDPSVDPGGKKQEVRNILAEIMAKLAHVTSRGMQQAIMSGIDAAISALNGGDVDEAMTIASNTLELTNQAVELCTNIEGLLNDLKSIANALPEPAKSTMEGIIADAEAAMDVATDPSDLQGILNLLQEADQVGKFMLSVPKDSPAFAQGLAELGMIAAEIGVIGQPNGQQDGQGGPGGAGGLGADTLALLGGNPLDAIKRMLAQENDHFGAAQLRQLEKKLMVILGQLDALPGNAARQEAADALRRILSLAGQGQYAEANAEAQALFERLDRTIKLELVVDQKLLRATQMAASLNGPAKAALLRVIQGVQARKAEATSPDDLLKLDELLMQAMRAAECASSGGPNAARELLKLNALARKVNPGGTSPLGCDQYAGSRGTRPLSGGPANWMDGIQVDPYLNQLPSAKGSGASDPPSDPSDPPSDPDEASAGGAKVVVEVAIAVEAEPSPGA